MALAGKVAVVTGGSRGIGAAVALKLALEGATVAGACLDDGAGQRGSQLVLHSYRTLAESTAPGGH